MVLLATPPKATRPKKAEVEVLIVRSCLGKLHNVEGLKHLDFGSRIKVAGDGVRDLIQSGAALYTSKEDDENIFYAHTVTPAIQSAVESELRLRQEAEKRRAEGEAYTRAQRLALIEKYGTA